VGKKRGAAKTGRRKSVIMNEDEKHVGSLRGRTVSGLGWVKPLDGSKRATWKGAIPVLKGIDKEKGRRFDREIEERVEQKL